LGGKADGRLEVIRNVLQGDEPPTAILASSPNEALPVVWVAAQLGLKVPRDLSLVTFRERVLNEIGIAITTCRHPMESVGARAVSMLLDKVDSGAAGVATPSVAIPYAEPVGDTICPPLT
jgi:LacI family transcriptional regulator